LSSELSDLYQEVILDHNRRPRNYGKLEGANREQEGLNPLCGDHMVIYLQLGDDKIENVGFEAQGCAISKASASLMTDAVKGKTPGEVEELFQRVHAMLTAPQGTEPDLEGLGKLAVLSGVRDYPSRIKCASLGWHALRAAIKQEAATPVSTE
jgi:nitrogen fixation protein NifU and related proteins